jgi:hypothetical protein
LSTQTLVIVNLVLQAESVVLKTVTGLDLSLDGLVLFGELFSLSNHAVNLLLRETTLVVGDSDRFGFSSSLVTSGNLEDTVGVEVKGDFDLRNATGRGGDAGKLELSEKIVILGHGTLSLIYYAS